jgi:MFS family permease
LIAVSVGWALSIGVRFVYPALVPFFRAEFQMDLSTVGLLLTALWIAYAVGHIPGGILGDRLGEGNILSLSTAISTGAVLIVAIAVDAWMLFVGTVLFGLATALYGPTRFTIFTDIYPKNSGSAVGLTMAAGSFGSTIFPAVSASIATYLAWRLGFGVFVPLFGAAFVLLWFSVPDRTSTPTSAVNELSMRTLGRIRDGITSESIPVLVLIQTTVSFIIQGFTSFYPSYLIATKGITPSVAAALLGLFFAIGGIIQPLSGSLMTYLGTQKTLLTFLSGCVLALWLLPFADGLASVIGITILFSSWNGCGVITQTDIADSLPTEMQGTGFGTLKAGWMTVGATSPLLVGILADYGYFDEGFLLLAAVGTVGVIVSFLCLPD